LLIVTFRTEFQPPWTGQEQVSTLALNRLDRHDRTVLAKQIAGGKTLPNEVVAQIADRTDGVPLFVEELTKSILESGLLREAGDRYVLVRQRSRDVYRSRRNVGGRSLRSLSAKASQRLTPS